MGLFNRNKQEKEAPPAAAGQGTPATTTTTTAAPSSPPRHPGSETAKQADNTYHTDDDPIHEDEDEDFDEEEAHKATTWDEGGASHCGYSDSVHDTLMKVGGGIHGVVGEPPQWLEKQMNLFSNWFQEMSYAVRDFTRGESKMTDDIADVMNSVMNEDDDEEGGDDPHTTTPAATASS